MQRFSSFRQYSVIDRTKRHPEKEMGPHVFVCSRAHASPSAAEQSAPLTPRVAGGPSVSQQAAATQDPGVVAHDVPPGVVAASVVSRWAEEKAQEAEYLPVPIIPHQERREGRVHLLDTM